MNSKQAEAVFNLQTLLRGISEHPTASLINREKLGTALSFDGAKSLFDTISQTSQRLLEVQWEGVPLTLLTDLRSQLAQVAELLGQISNFSPAAHQNAGAHRDSLIQQLEAHWDQTFTNVRLMLGPLGQEIKSNEFDALLKQAQLAMKISEESVENIQARQRNFENQLEQFLEFQGEKFKIEATEKLKEVADALDKVRSLATEAGVSQHARYFDEEAKEYDQQSRLWILVLTIAGILLLLYGVFGGVLFEKFGLNPAVTQNSILDAAKLVSQRALLAFILVFAVIWSARNYAAAKHNSVVNRHRRNSMGSFETFAKSSSDDSTKNALLLQATQSIFSPQASGFVKDGGDSAPSNQILEVIRSVNGKESK